MGIDPSDLKDMSVQEKIDVALPLEIPLPFPKTDVMRFDFQRFAISQTKGIVIQCGTNEDPAGLQEVFGPRVINTDIHAYDTGMGRPNRVDRLMDITEPEHWRREFADDSAEMVLFGDVLEHLPYEQVVIALREGRRVAQKLCVTVPEDHRIDGSVQYSAGSYNLHMTVMTEEVVRAALAESGWKPYLIARMHWGCGGDAADMFGYGVEAHRI